MKFIFSGFRQIDKWASFGVESDLINVQFYTVLEKQL